MNHEGVIKFESLHTKKGLQGGQLETLSRKLGAWRTILWDLELIGQDEGRYGGLGFGNVSVRLGASSAFLISGTQTGRVKDLKLNMFSLVNSYDLRVGKVCSQGLVLPSSESMTHAAVYTGNPSVNWIFHVHSPILWRHVGMLELPRTKEGVEYGTLAMVKEIHQWQASGASKDGNVLCMSGHEDGFISVGRSASQAGRSIVEVLASALAMDK